MYQVIKRDGRRVDFDLARIANAITKAFDAAKIPYNTAIIDLLALQVTADYAGKVRNNEIGVEDIQDSVEAVLQRAGYAAVSRRIRLMCQQTQIDFDLFARSHTDTAFSHSRTGDREW